MVEIDLRRREDIPEFEDFDKFCNSGKEAPDVYLFMHITYAIKDIEVTTKQFLGTYRLPVQKQTLLEYMKTNDFIEVSEQLLNSIDKAKHVMFYGSSDDEIASGSYKMIEKMHKLKKTKFTGNLPKNINKDTMKSEEVLDSYVLYRTGKSTVCEGFYKFTPKNVAEVDISSILAKVFEDKIAGKNAKTFEDALNLLSEMKDMSAEQMKLLVKKTKAAHDIWVALSPEELYRIIKDKDATTEATVYYDTLVRLKEKS